MIKNHKEFFNEMAESWDQQQQSISPEKYRRLVKECKISSRQTILDIGTGTGVFIPYLLETIGNNGVIFAVDYAENMIEKFITKRYPENVKPMVADIHKTDFCNNFFDRIIANACYPHFDKKQKALKEIYRILKKGGIFIISHIQGRTFINNLHRTAHNIIAKDMIPPLVVLKGFGESCGFRFLKGIDEEDFFFISFTK